MKIHKRFPAHALARPLANAAAAVNVSVSPSASVSSPVSGSSSSPIPIRVRSNSASRSLYTAASSSSPLQFGFFDSPTPPRSPNANSTISPRLVTEVKAEVEIQQQHHNNGNSSSHSTSGNSNSSNPPPYSLVFSSSQPEAGLSTNPSGQHLQAHYQLLFPNHSLPPPSALSDDLASNSVDSSESTGTPRKRQRLRYQLDVGAYGIPKHGRNKRVAGRDGFVAGSSGSQSTADESLAVQVGEDAYFIRDNAMGVADGVGGWARARKQSNSPSPAGLLPTPSAVFARRLMHFCAEEVEAASRPSPSSATASSTSSAHFDNHAEDLWALGSHPDLVDQRHPCAEDTETSAYSEMTEELDSELEDLADGLDVLNILERAYERTLKAHVREVDLEEDYGICEDDEPARGQSTAEDQSHEEARPHTRSIPLMEGSSTALLAVLEPSPLSLQSPSTLSPKISAFQSPSPSPSPPLSAEHASQKGRRSSPLVLLNPQARRLLARGTPAYPEPPRYSSSRQEDKEKDVTAAEGAILKIAHLGDCVAMLVRGEEIVWRTEEMWWNFNTPLQLGPSSSTTPASAQVFSIPVQADDILILASDGLSDNLWDEDVLDEVVRMRRSWSSLGSGPKKGSTASDGDGPVSSRILGRGTLAGMLSEALCSRARCVSERRPQAYSRRSSHRRPQQLASDIKQDGAPSQTVNDADDIPFGRRAREEGRWFAGGKLDDISVLVAVVSPRE